MVELSESALRPPLRRAAAAGRRRRILDAAAELFEGRGYERTTIDDVAALGGITKRTLYRYVCSKERLLYEIHEGFLDELLDEVTALSGSPRERFGAMIGITHARTTVQHRHAVSVLSEEMKYVPREARRRVRSQLRSVYEQVRAIVEGGQRDGEFRGTDPGVVTLVVLGVINSTYRWYRHEAGFSLGVLAANLLRLVQHGIGSLALRAVTKPGRRCSVRPAHTARRTT